MNQNQAGFGVLHYAMPAIVDVQHSLCTVCPGMHVHADSKQALVPPFVPCSGIPPP
jgi:hypothetical protein